MAFIKRVFKTRIYRCDGCGKESYWDEGWSSYGSIAHMEACPDDMLTACSDECMAVIERKLKSGEYKMPGVKNREYYIDKVSERKGY